MNEFAKGCVVVLGPEEGESHWQPLPSTGYITMDARTTESGTCVEREELFFGEPERSNMRAPDVARTTVSDVFIC